MTRPAIRSIIVAGDGIVGLSAALAFRRALPAVAISVLRLPRDPAAMADAAALALSTVGRFHAAIGFDELDLIRRGVAVHHLGTRHAGGGAGDWTHSFGEVGRDEGAVPFHQMWLGARRDGEALPFDDYSPAAVIGAAGKFVHPSGDPASPLASYLYGLRLDPVRYRALLELATKDIERVDGPVARIERRDDGGIATLRLAEERSVTADLYLDCSGPSGLLHTSVDDTFEDWAGWLPACHVATTTGDAGPPGPFAMVDAIDHGWRLVASVPAATLRTTVTTVSTPQSIALRPGRRRSAFVANVLALGDAAVALDPLHGANLSLAHSAIHRAIDLIPGRDCHSLERAEYNRLTALESDRARDFHALFQAHLPGVAPPPESLARTLVQWRSRGRLPFFEEETFTASSWTQALIGTGHVPDAITPLAGAVDRPAAGAAMARLARDLAGLAERLPSYPDYLGKVMQAPPR